MNIALVDDDWRILDELQSLIEEFMKEKGYHAHIFPFTEPFEMLESKNSFSLIFLDIEMPSMNGIDLGKKIREKSIDAVIIFVTNMAQYAIEGYSVNAYDYILKPIKKNVFKAKLDRFFKEAEKQEEGTVSVNSKYNNEIIRIADLKYIEVRGHKLIYHLRDKEIESWGSISKLSETLKDKGFSLASSSFLVNLSFVSRIKGDDIYLENEVLRFTRTRKKAFLNDLAEYLR